MEMLAVGRELLIGRTLDTNSNWVGRRLATLGAKLSRTSTVDDELGEIVGALRESMERRTDFAIVVGGLGPTPDDMTLRGVAAGLGFGLRTNPRAMAMIAGHYEGAGLGRVPMTAARRKMALLPEGSEPLENETGTAPGVRVVSGRAVIFCLPGVPLEMRRMFRRSVEPELKKAFGRVYRHAATLKLEGVMESALAPVIERQLKARPGTYIKSHPRGIEGGLSMIELDVAVVSDDAVASRSEVEAVVMEIVRAVRRAGGRARPVKARL